MHLVCPWINRLVVMLALWLAGAFSLHSAFGQRVFHVDIENGLCTNALTDLTCDRQGNMWIGSMSGLMKYSGTGIKCFEKVGSTPDALSGPEMHSIAEDACGNIWVGTTAGLDKINPVTYEIEHFPIESPYEDESSVGYIYAVYADRYDFVWLSTDVAMFKFDILTSEYHPVPVTKDQHGIIQHHVSYNGFVEDDAGLWISTGAGMAYYHYQSKLFYHLYHNPDRLTVFTEYLKPYTDHSGMEMDTAGRLWFVRDQDHLAWYDVRNNSMDSVQLPVPRGTWRCCYSIAVDPHQQVWVGTRHGGVLIFNPDTRSFTHLRAEGPNRLIQSDYIYSIERGAEGKIFVAHDMGMDIIDLYDTSIREYKVSDAADFVNLKYGTGKLTFDDRRNVLYIPYYGHSVVEFDPVDASFTMHRTDVDGLHPVGLVFIDGENNFITQQGNVRRAVITTDTMYVLPGMLLGDIMASFSNDVVWCYRSAPGTYYFKKGSGKIFYASGDDLRVMEGEGFKPNICISPDSLYLSYINRSIDLVRINMQTDIADTIRIQSLLRDLSFPLSNPRHIVDDGRAVWITGQNGLLRVDYQSSSVKSYSMNNGLSHTFTFSTVLDKQGVVWVGSIGGIDRYNPITDRFESVHKIRDNTYMDAFGDAILSAAGDIYFLFGNKIIVIQPEHLAPASRLFEPLNLLEVQVNGISVDFSASSVLNQLSYKQNQLNFTYDLHWFGDPDLVQFQYRLNEAEWVDNDQHNSVHLAGLQPGDYTLEVKVAGESATQPNTLIIPFRIQPPFWLTWWFRLLLGGMILAVTVIVFQRRIKHIKEKSSLEMQMIHLKSTALRAQMNPHFVFNSLNAIQECVVTGKVDEAYTYLSKFSRLLRLVLEHSDKHAVLLQDELEVLSLYLTLEELRFKEDMQFEIRVSPELEPEEIYLPPMLIQPHLENAIWHGLRFLDGAKKLSIDLAEYQKTYLRIVVEDNGIGREKASALRDQRITPTPHRSMGTKLSSEQLSLLQHQYVETRVIITDLTDEDRKPSGTRVELILPMMEKTNLAV
jgi:streptogramin lyase